MKTRMLLSLLILFASGCSSSRPIRVGAKGFDEQAILAETTARLLKEAGYPVEPVVQCGDTYSCYRGLRDGTIDVLVDYTGTGLVFEGETGWQEGDALGRLQTLYAPTGITWLGLLGFDNDYQLYVRAAGSNGAHAISDLADRRGITVACPKEYLRRPLDGLQSLVSHYGLRLLGKPLASDNPQERVDALLDGRADVAVLYGTDGANLDPRITRLEDDLDFFPQYEAAYLVRSAALKKYRKLDETLMQLTGKFPTETMRELNRRVQVEGMTPAGVALDFLIAEGLLDTTQTAHRKVPDLLVSRHAADDLGAFENRALKAIRTAFDGRTVVLDETATPTEDVYGGKARLALLGAERFFGSQGGLPRREERLEAVAVLGLRMLHLVRREEDGQAPLAGTLGTQPAATGAGRIGQLLLRHGELPVAAQGDATTLLAKVRSRELDGALLVLEAGRSDLVSALESGGLVLRPIPEPLLKGLPLKGPYLRIVRIPAGTYPGQAGPIRTVGSQVVLAAPRRTEDQLESTGGPATALPTRGQPLSPGRVQALAAATDYHEAPNPALPSAWAAALPEEEPRREQSAAVDTVLNGLVLLFFAWLVYVALRRERGAPGSAEE